MDAPAYRSNQTTTAVRTPIGVHKSPCSYTFVYHHKNTKEGGLRLFFALIYLRHRLVLLRRVNCDAPLARGYIPVCMLATYMAQKMLTKHSSSISCNAKRVCCVEMFRAPEDPKSGCRYHTAMGIIDFSDTGSVYQRNPPRTDVGLPEEPIDETVDLLNPQKNKCSWQVELMLEQFAHDGMVCISIL